MGGRSLLQSNENQAQIILFESFDGKSYKGKYYNLDVIISVGYRVKSQRGVEFRRWATDVLRRYIIDGRAQNELRLQ